MKLNVYKIKCDKKNLDLIIGLPQEISTDANTESLREFKNIRYYGVVKIKASDKQCFVHKIEFLNLDNFLFDFINDLILKELTKLNVEDISLQDVFTILNEYFKKTNIEYEIIKNLIGDLGEIYFIYKSQQLGIDAQKFYQPTGYSLFDFNIKGKNIDIKTTTKRKKTIYINLRQLDEQQHATFLLVEINKLHGKTNILQLIELIKNKTKYINELYSKWKTINLQYPEIISSWTIDIKKHEIYVLDKTMLPNIKIISRGGLLDGEVIVNTACSKNKKLDKNFFIKK